MRILSEAEKELKKEKILKLYRKAPKLSNQDIAELTDSSPNYVRKLLNPIRHSIPIDQKMNVINKLKELNSKEWKAFKAVQVYFARTYLPQKIYKSELPFIQKQRQVFNATKRAVSTEDFDYFMPTDDITNNYGTGSDLSGSWSQYEYLAEKRTGLGKKIVTMPAEDAVLEGFKWLSKKTREVVPTSKIKNKYDPELNMDQWQEDTDFLNNIVLSLKYDRTYGIGFIIPHFSENDKAKGILNTPIKETEGTIKAFDVLPPTVVAPVDSYTSNKLDKNPQKWSIQGGYNDPQAIHYSRVRVIMTRPSIHRWYGMSIFEPIWHSIIPYYMSLIFLLRGFAKFGNTVVKYLIDSNEDLADIVNDHAELLEEMRMNGIMIGKLGTEIGFEPTQLAKGLRDLVEIWLEDIAAGVEIAIPILMGRIVAAGLSGQGYVIAERYYQKMIKRIQLAITDDVRALIKLAGFEIDDYILDWNLSITKTDQQRLMDETMQVELDMMKEELIQKRILTDRMIAESLNPQQPQKSQENEPPINPTNGGKKALDANQMKIAKDMMEDLRAKIRARRKEYERQLTMPFVKEEVLSE